MKLSHRLWGIGLLGGAVLSGCAGGDEGGAPDDGADATRVAHGALQTKDVSGRVIVKFHDQGGLRTLTRQALAARTAQNHARIESTGGRVVHDLGRVNAVAAELSAAQVAALKSDPRVAFVEQDPERRPFLPSQVRAVTPLAETAPYGIGMVQADQVSDEFIANRKVCIVDTGYDGTHEDLRPAPDSNVTGNDNDGLGADTGDWFYDGYGHGTHVAGTISALAGNDKGVVGVTGSNQVGLHIVKVFDDGGGWAYGSDLVIAVEQCIAAGANVISMSLGGSGSSSVEQAAFDNALAAGVLSIAAAGNGASTWLSYPASYPAVTSVAALDESKSLAWFSQQNAEVELAAPGVAVLSTIPGNGYEAWDGTSMATPHVSGVAALVWSHFPDCSAQVLRAVLNHTAEDLGAVGRDNGYGFGLVQARAAFDWLSENGCTMPPEPPPPPPPVATELTNGVPVDNLTGASGSETLFVIDVPDGATNLLVQTYGGAGDADLYVRFGAAPTTTSFDCRPYIGGNYETCSFSAPSAGKYYVMTRGYSSYSAMSLVASFEAPRCPSTTLVAEGLPISIPDNDRTGIRAIISSDLVGVLEEARLSAAISHTYRGDLVVTLIAPSGASYLLSNRAGGPADDLYLDTDVPTFAGLSASGDWQLVVQDRAARDVGTLNSFELTLTPACEL